MRVAFAISALCASVQAAQPSAPSPVSAPLRELPWAQLNFLHTTDTHGWHAGHLQEPSYSADWGDYISFADRLRERADREKKDLLLIDTGDRIEGNGLYDASDPKGLYTRKIFKEQTIDVICIGNHELYKNYSSNNEYLHTVPDSEGNYLASNLDIMDPSSGKWVPLAQRYRKFTTKNQGIRIIAFGFLFDFQTNSRNTRVQKVEDTIKEQWFQQAIRDREVDLFVIAGHIPLRSSEFSDIFKAIREVQWDTPIQFFGGHSHIRDYAKYDANAYAMESGRYMETIGFMSIDGLATGGKPRSNQGSVQQASHLDAGLFKSSHKFARRYIDNNLYSFRRHTALNETSFPTERGRNVSAMISAARQEMQLDKRFGCAPSDLWTNRAPYPSNQSIFTWLQDQVLPGIVLDEKRGSKPRLVFTNTGAIRFDIFKGPFSVDNTFTVSPFTSGLRYVKDVPLSIAKRLLAILNQEVPQLVQFQDLLGSIAPVPSTALSDQAVQHQDFEPTLGITPQQAVLIEHANSDVELSPGYTTTDDAGSDGDDTIHSKIKFYKVPNCIESRVDFPGEADAAEPETVDVVYNDFIESYVLLALKFLGTDHGENDTEVYMKGWDMTRIISTWISKEWPCED